MKFKIFQTFIFVLLFSVAILGKQPEWFKKIRNIELLKANRDDVIKVFGEPSENSFPYFPFYQLLEGTMQIEYSWGRCGNNNKNGWDVPEFSVTRIFFEPKKIIRPKNLGINLKSFRKKESYDVPGAFVFSNEEMGISFDVKRNGNIESIEFRPSNKYDKLYCNKEHSQQVTIKSVL